jgi:hypothetical protein
VLDLGCSRVRELTPGRSSYRDLSVADLEPWAATLLNNVLDRHWGGF